MSIRITIADDDDNVVKLFTVHHVEASTVGKWIESRLVCAGLAECDKCDEWYGKWIERYGNWTLCEQCERDQ